MVSLIWLVLCLVVVVFAVALFALWRRDILNRYSGGRPVRCPENGEDAVVSIDAKRAADTRLDGRARICLAECSRWPERGGCDQVCLSQAMRAEPYPEVHTNRNKKTVYHLPIVMAAFVAWFVGALWHSQFLFRARWTDAVGLRPLEVKQIVWWLSPHLLSAGMCLLFAYGVAWLLAISHRKGVLQGILAAIALCGALAGASWYGLAKMPHDLFMIEAGYALLATLAVGAIVGGLEGRLVLPPE